MFTGLIQGLGRINSLSPHNEGALASLFVGAMSSEISIGDSISVNGVCSTVKTISDDIITIDYLSETLKKTTIGSLRDNDAVNLELAMTLNTKMGGHMVQGHVDCVGRIESFELKDPWSVVCIEFPEDFGKFLVEKGSISVDGVSLTLVDVQKSLFSCHLIPHTVENTVFSNYKKDDKVNLEFDIVGKYLYKFYSQTQKN
ncbi:riboflavin synthase [Candidatus Marinamargulisbacteria bacterium SCGC AAA071-K20]|nr:riboflavin synthase [Candidatus Marinamargulisbacteria bacterium SCGC AAA071-K20]